MCYRRPHKHKPSKITSRKCNNCVGPCLHNSPMKYQRKKVLKLKNSNLSLTNFRNSFLMNPKCQTMSPQQEATASLISYPIVWLGEFTKVDHGAGFTAFKPRHVFQVIIIMRNRSHAHSTPSVPCH